LWKDDSPIIIRTISTQKRCRFIITASRRRRRRRLLLLLLLLFLFRLDRMGQEESQSEFEQTDGSVDEVNGAIRTEQVPVEDFGETLKDPTTSQDAECCAGEAEKTVPGIHIAPGLGCDELCDDAFLDGAEGANLITAI
jgi:hypothetical protein